MPGTNTAPPTPEKGFLWLDNSEEGLLVLREFDGTEWAEIDRDTPDNVGRLEEVVATKARTLEPELEDVEPPAGMKAAAGKEKNRPWFTFKTADDGGVPEIEIYDEIGFWGTTARDFMAKLKEHEDAEAIVVRVNSPGGDPFASVAIHNALKRMKGEVRVHIDGLAASGASMIAMAGARVVMASNALMMIHKAWGLTIGNADDMREAAAVADKIDAMQIATYCAKTGMDADACAELLRAETWMTADEAVANGFADEKADPVAMRVSFDRSALKTYSKVPADLLASLSAGAAEARAEKIAGLCAAAEMPGEIERFLKTDLSADGVAKRIEAMKEIRTLCVAAKRTGMFESLKEKSVEEARTALFAELVKGDAEISSTLPALTEKGTGKQPAAAKGMPAFDAAKRRKLMSRGSQRRV